jgi:hypothetical protein
MNHEAQVLSLPLRLARAWLEEHQQKHEELRVGFYKEETRLKRLATAH